jgi:hypothetical protein
MFVANRDAVVVNATGVEMFIEDATKYLIFGRR